MQVQLKSEAHFFSSPNHLLSLSLLFLRSNNNLKEIKFAQGSIVHGRADVQILIKASPFFLSLARYSIAQVDKKYAVS